MQASPEASDGILTLRTYAKGDAMVIECNGRLNSSVRGMLQAEVKRLLPDTKWIILDLTNLWQMDSMGLGAIISVYVSAKSAGCKLELIHLSKRVRELLGMTNLLSVFGVIAEEPPRFL